MSGRTIHEVPLVSEVKGGMKIPISDGGNLPQTASVEQINKFISDQIKIYVKDILERYVEKIDGKGLSTNDFTNSLKEKLNGLSNYDDTEIVSNVEKLQNVLDTLVSGNSSAAIESFNEIISFLENIEDSESFEGIIAGITSSIKGVESKLSELGSEVGIVEELPITVVNNWNYNNYYFKKGVTYILSAEKKVASVYTLTKPEYSETVPDRIVDKIGTIEVGVEYEYTPSSDTMWLCSYSNWENIIRVKQKDNEIDKLNKRIDNNGQEIINRDLRNNIVAYLSDGKLFRWDADIQTGRKIYFDGDINIKFVDIQEGYEFTWDKIKEASTKVGLVTDDADKSVTVNNTGSLFFNTETKDIEFSKTNVLGCDKRYVILFSCNYVSFFTGLLVLSALEKKHTDNIKKIQDINGKLTTISNAINVVAYIGEGKSFKWDASQSNRKIYFEGEVCIKYVDGAGTYEFYWDAIKESAIEAGLSYDDNGKAVTVGATGSLWFNVETKSIVFSSANTLGGDKKYIPLFVGHYGSFVCGLLIDNEVIKKYKKDESELVDENRILAFNPYEDVLEKVIQSQRLSPDGYTPTPSNRRNILTLLHFSDLHADSENLQRIVEFKSVMGSYIDDAIHTGDTAETYIGINVFENVNGADKILNMIGNHDAWRSGESFYNATSKECYDYILKKSIASWGVQQPENAESNGYCYYFKDYVNAKVRLIVLDCMHYDEMQESWFVSALDNARNNNLSVIVSQHYPAWNGVEKIDTPFCDYEKNIQKIEGEYYPASERMIDSAYSVVDNYISNGGIFICWLQGHTHYPMIGTTPNHDKQLQVIVDNAGAFDYYNNSSRVRGTKTQDGFNLISVDTQSKLIKVVRVGSQFDRFMRKMDVLCYDYGNQKLIQG